MKTTSIYYRVHTRGNDGVWRPIGFKFVALAKARAQESKCTNSAKVVKVTVTRVTEDVK